MLYRSIVMFHFVFLVPRRQHVQTIKWCIETNILPYNRGMYIYIYIYICIYIYVHMCTLFSPAKAQLRRGSYLSSIVITFDDQDRWLPPLLPRLA